MGSYAGQVGTRNVARDLEAIRITLGEPKLDYLGYSYGTILGITYAQMFPTTVDHMVLDGPPDVWLTWRDYTFQQAQGFMNALQRVPRLVPTDQLLPRVRRRAPRRAAAAHRPGRPAAVAGVVHARRRDARRRAHARPARERCDLHALRPIPGLADPGRRPARGGAAGSGRFPALTRRPVHGSSPGRYVESAGGVQRGHQLRRPAEEERTEHYRGARRRRHLPGSAPALGRVVGDRAVCRDAQAGEGRQAGRGAGAGRTADPDRGHDRRPGDAVHGRRRRWWAASPGHNSSRSTAPSTPRTGAPCASTMRSTRTSWRARCRPSAPLRPD